MPPDPEEIPVTIDGVEKEWTVLMLFKGEELASTCTWWFDRKTLGWRWWRKLSTLPPVMRKVLQPKEMPLIEYLTPDTPGSLHELYRLVDRYTCIYELFETEQH